MWPTRSQSQKHNQTHTRSSPENIFYWTKNEKLKNYPPTTIASKHRVCIINHILVINKAPISSPNVILLSSDKSVLKILLASESRQRMWTKTCVRSVFVATVLAAASTASANSQFYAKVTALAFFSLQCCVHFILCSCCWYVIRTQAPELHAWRSNLTLAPKNEVLCYWPSSSFPQVEPSLPSSMSTALLETYPGLIYRLGCLQKCNERQCCCLACVNGEFAPLNRIL